MKKPHPLYLSEAAALLLALVLSLVFALHHFYFQGHTTAPLQNTCRADRSDEKEQKHCYETFYQSLAESSGVARAIAALTLETDSDKELAASCHSVMHEIGHVAAKEYGSLGSAFDSGSSLCANGFYHGVVEELFGDKDLNTLSAEDIVSICSPSLLATTSPLLRLNCVHGIGHALMYMSGGNITVALLRCEDYELDDDISQCATGALMEEGFRIERSTSSIEKIPDPTLVCSQVPGDQRDCWLSQSAKVIEQKEGGSEKALTFCGAIHTPDYRRDCISSLKK